MSWTEDAKVAATGKWLYDGSVELTVRIVALPYDYWYELGKADDRLEPGEVPTPRGPDGLLYYVSFAGLDSSGYPTVKEAKAAATARLSAPISWTER